ncbi:zinc finger and SCAN domain-containing protein 31-like [Uranotaenia lowii]|uniref:zinc finger and SCAN domain-containing protein 31-like n=1 Tax=Uranotaenia lowii TaxID=190385 RepID=UPI002479C8D7|nr:zinc finger and SCAN domain-containing protein 31-like [Uranotaenia lowii]
MDHAAKPTFNPIKKRIIVKSTHVGQCRLCLRIISPKLMHEIRAATHNLQRKIIDAVGVSTHEGDKLNKICNNCFNIVDMIHAFRRACLKTNVIHSEKLLLLDTGNWTSLENQKKITDCHDLVKRHSTQIDCLYDYSKAGSDKVESLPAESKPPNIKQIQSEVESLPAESKPPNIKQIQSDSDEDGSDAIDHSLNETKSSLDSWTWTQPVHPLITNKNQIVHSQINYIKYRKQKRIDEKRIVCEICGLVIDKLKYETHKNRHLNKRPYTCKFENCNLSFFAMVSLKRHRKTVHNAKFFECSICLKKLKGSVYWKHQQIHRGEGKVTCKICGKNYFKHYYKTHLATHTGALQYQCDICKQRFLTKQNVQVHRKSKHKDAPDIDYSKLVTTDC